MPNFISEEQIERALVQKLQHLHGFDSLICHTEDPEDLNDGSNRASKRDVILVDLVREAALRLNPKIPAAAIEDALEKLLDKRFAMSLVAANQEVYQLLRDGIPVEFDDAHGQKQQDRVRLIDFNDAEQNRYLAVTQLWIKGERGFRRPDVLLYVNGLPLVFIELKNSNVKLKTAFDDNLTNYKNEIPQLFLTNALCVLSNAIETKVGSITSEWEHFFNWLRADSEKEKVDLAENMRAGLKNAQYLAFTGTPLLGSERKTNQWFGDYVSEFNFQQSMDDGATVPLFYEKRVPQVLIQNDDLSGDFAEIVEDENLDDAQQAKLENKFAQEIEVIKREDRLETIARDIVAHFPRRGYRGKGMVVTLDKFTAVKMYDKVQRLWKERIKELRGESKQAKQDDVKKRLQKQLDYMRSVEMAVIVSEEAEEEKKFAKQNLAIKPHRDRMNRVDEHGHDVEYNFKDPEHPLQLVFVCAMWLTGFDAPTVSTLYLNKPMKDHTLMQTIARANRVTPWKINGVEKKTGELVDYYNVFRNMNKALKDYAQGTEGQENLPVREKKELFKLLDDAITQGMVFCSGLGIDLATLLKSIDVFKNVSTFDDYADKLLTKDEWRKGFAVYENTITCLYEACKPEIPGSPIVHSVAVFQYLRGVLDAIIEQKDIDAVALRVGELLDESLVVQSESALQDSKPEFRITQFGKTWDLSKINFDKLKADFKAAPHKNIEIADLRAFIQHKLEQMLKENATRTDFAARLQGIIDRYNAGSSSADNYFEELTKFAQDMKAETERHIREGLTEEELELFDLLKKPKMTKAETEKVRLAAKSLLHRLREESPKVLIQDWFKDSQSRERGRSTVQLVLDRNLPETYDRTLFTEKCNGVFDLMLRYASNGVKWAAGSLN